MPKGLKPAKLIVLSLLTSRFVPMLVLAGETQQPPNSSRCLLSQNLDQTAIGDIVKRIEAEKEAKEAEEKQS